MPVNTLDERESKVLDFIRAKEAEASHREMQDRIMQTPEMKYNKLNDEYRKGTEVCLDTILGRIYKDALPFEDPQKNCSDDCAAAVVHDFIDRRTGGKGTEWYVREALKRTESPTLQKILEAVKSFCDDFYREKTSELATIDIKDLNFNRNYSMDELNKITKDLEMDEISSIIHDNVQKSLQDEKDRVAREDEYKKKVEDSLSEDMTVTDDKSLQEAVDNLRATIMPRIYQPSLFEAILTSKTKSFMESADTATSPMFEAIHEYTLLNMAKALRLESFNNLSAIAELANSYLA